MVRHMDNNNKKDTNWFLGFGNQSRKKMVTIIVPALFATTLAELIINWYYTYICLVEKTKVRQDTFILSVVGTSVVNNLAVLMRGIGQILADALLVSTQINLTARYGILINS